MGNYLMGNIVTTYSEDTGVLHLSKRDFRIIPFIRLRGSSLLQTQYLRRTGRLIERAFSMPYISSVLDVR